MPPPAAAVAARDFLPTRGELQGEVGRDPAALLAPDEPRGSASAAAAPAAGGPLTTTPPSISCVQMLFEIMSCDVAFWADASICVDLERICCFPDWAES